MKLDFQETGIRGSQQPLEAVW